MISLTLLPWREDKGKRELGRKALGVKQNFGLNFPTAGQKNHSRKHLRKQLFISVPQNPNGRSKGHAFIGFASFEDAKALNS